MGFRIGTGLGPFSVSARIGGGGGGGGGGDGLGWLLFGGGVLVFGPTIIWILELDWKNIFLWWIFLHIFSSISLFGGLFALFKQLNNRLRAQQVFFGLVGPIVYLVCLHKFPLVEKESVLVMCYKECDDYSSEVTKVLFTAPAYHWLLSLGGAIILPTVLFLISSINSNQTLARKDAASKTAEITRQRERDKKRAEQAPANAALLAERDKRRAESKGKSSEKQVAYESKQKLTKDRRDALEDSLARLSEVTDKVFSQSPEPGSVISDGGNKIPESIEKALREALADVRNCLSACQGVLSRDQIGHHQSGLYNLRTELAERFGFQDI